MSEKAVVLVGLMGSGKTTAGRQLAERLHVAFVDTDTEIEAQTGRSPARIIEESGEPFFRQIERDVVLGELARSGRRVLALGGGAFLDPVVRDRCNTDAESVYLVTSSDVAAERALADAGSRRPLLDGDARARMAELLGRRADIYAQARHHVVTDRRSVDEIVDEIVARLDHD